MKRTIAAIVGIGMLAIPLLVPTAQAAAKAPKAIKITNKGGTDPTSVVGGSPWPLGLNNVFGRLQVTFPSPATTQAITSLTLVCTPLAETGIPAYSATFPVSVSGGKYVSTVPSTGTNTTFSSTPTSITLASKSEMFTNKYPASLCRVDATNAVGTTPGVAPKLPTSPSADCTGKPGDSINGVAPRAPIAPVGTTQYLSVTVDAGGGLIFPFCTTFGASTPTVPGAVPYTARVSTEQETIFTSSSKHNTKKKQAEVKNLVLTAPVGSSIPLVVTQSVVVYGYDKTKFTGGTCKGGTSCVVDPVAGTITFTSTKAAKVKVGAPIVSTKNAVTLTYTTVPTGPQKIWFVSATSSISVNGTPVNVILQSRGPGDPNYQAAAVNLAGF